MKNEKDILEKEQTEKNININSEKVKKNSLPKNKINTAKKGISKKAKVNAVRKRNMKRSRTNPIKNQVLEKTKKENVSEIKVEELPKTDALTETQLIPKKPTVEVSVEEPTKATTNKKKVVFKAILALNIIVCLGLLGYSLYNIYEWYQDGQKTLKQVEMIEEKVEIEEKEDTEQTEIIEQEEEIPKSDPYWDYIKIPLMNVNFGELKATNSDVKGWLQVKGTNINYPFVQAKNNEYYLTHSFDKSYNAAGWVFLDYRNDLTKTQKNTILYAHGRWEGTMFGSLRNVLKSNWYKNKNNHVIRLSTEKENTLWQVFSVYQIPVTSDYIQTEFVDDELFLELLLKLQERSYYDFGVTLSGSDSIITLSTCNQDDERIVMHAKLIKREAK